MTITELIPVSQKIYEEILDLKASR